MKNTMLEMGVKRNEKILKGSQEYIEKYFPVVKASTLTLKDEFLKYNPNSYKQKVFRENLCYVIESGLNDFRAQRMDATINDDGNLCYNAGKKPAVKKQADWWLYQALKFMPEKESRLGTTKERIAFCGLLIKYLIEEKDYEISEAWKAVCNQSRNIGHYANSSDTNYEMEVTGSRQVGQWYDLANTYKITVDADNIFGLSITGGSYTDFGESTPLASIQSILEADDYRHATGWVVTSV